MRTNRHGNKSKEKSNQASTHGKQWVNSRNYKTGKEKFDLKKSVKECWMSKSKFAKFENSVKGALGDCEKSGGLGVKFLWEISKSHSSSRDYGQGQGNWRVCVSNT